MSQTTTPRRIAIVSDAIYPYHKGGKEVRVRQLATGLAALGHDVHVYTMKWWEGSNDRFEDGIHLHAISRLHPLYHGERRSIKQAVFYSAAIIKLLRADFDILEVDHMPYFPLFVGKIVSLLKRRPMYATWHEVWGRDYWRQYLGRAGYIAHLVERATVLLPDHIIAVSAHTAERLDSVMNCRKPVSIVANGVELADILAAEPAAHKSDLVYIGRLLEHKNVDLLIRATAKLKATRPDIRLVVIGDGPEMANLQQLATKLGVAGNTMFTGFVEQHRDAFGLVKASRVFVQPSTREGYGIVVAEGIACGLPVVTVDHPDNAARHLITPDTGKLAKPTVAGLAKVLAAVLDEAEGQPTRRASHQRFDWEHSTQALAKVYTS